MEHADYVYTTGMDEASVVERLRSVDHGVLALADGDEAYAVPLHHHYDGERLLFRVSGHDSASEKRRFLEATERATYVCYDPAGAWSVHVRGPVRQSEEQVDEATLNDWFPPFHLFDETVDEVAFVLYELEMAAVVGRETVE